jgi:hypothetical protein
VKVNISNCRHKTQELMRYDLHSEQCMDCTIAITVVDHDFGGYVWGGGGRRKRRRKEEKPSHHYLCRNQDNIELH